MNKLIIGVVIVAIAASTGISLRIQRRDTAQAREREEARGQLAETVTKLSADNERLSNLVTRMNSTEALSREQLGELLKLRHEVGQLRQAATEKTKLQQSNARLVEEAKEAGRKLAEAQALPNYWPKDQLAYAGYGDPESALKTILAAMNKGDYSAWRTMLTPQALAAMQKEMASHGMSEAQQEAQIKERGSSLTSAAVGFHILDETNPTPDETIINLSFDGEGAARKFVLKKVDNQWKFQDLVLAGEQRN